MRYRNEVGALRQRFNRELQDNDGKCPKCQKNISNMSNRTIINHADGKCWKRSFDGAMADEVDPEEFEPVLDADSSLQTIPVNLQDENQPENDKETQFNASEDEDDPTPALESWEADFLDASKEVQTKGLVRQTAAQVREYLRMPLYGTTVGNIVHRVSSAKMNLQAKNEVLQILKSALPHSKRRLIPNSMHIVRRALKVKDVASVEIHMCSSCWGHAWKPCRREDWPLHGNECTCQECTCPVCRKGKRFSQAQNTWSPSYVCYYLGLEHQIKTLFQMEDFRKSLYSDHSYDTKGSWRNSWHARWINGQTGGAANESNTIPIPDAPGEAFQRHNSIYSIHFDWVQIRTSKKKSHSVGLMILRNDSVEEEDLNTDRWAMPIMVMPGPKEPGSLRMHWKVLGDEFSRYENNGIVVRFMESNEVVEIVHKPFLARFICDAAACPKILSHRGAMATCPCPWCDFRSSGNGRVYGYCDPVEYKAYDLVEMLAYAGTGEFHTENTKSVQIGVTDPAQYKHDEARLRQIHSTLEEANQRYQDGSLSKLRVAQIQKETGYSDKSDIIWRSDLKAIHPIHAVQVPIYHCLILGLVSDFLKHIFIELNPDNPAWEVLKPHPEGVKKIRSAPEGITMNCEQSDRCINTELWSGFLISSLLTFLEVYSCYLFNEDVCGFKTLSNTAAEAWGLLRKSVLYFIRDEEAMFDNWEESRTRALCNLVEYAKMCQKYMPSLCTQNLHVAVCRLAEQERYCGRPNICHDLYMERNIRVIKEFEKSYRHNHERSFVKRVLEKSVTPWLSEHMQHALSHNPKPSESATDSPSSDSMTHMMGKGTACESSLEASTLIHHCAEACDPDQISVTGVSNWTVYKHTSCLLHRFNRFEIVKSIESNKETQRFSKIVLVMYGGEKRLALVRKFLRVALHGETLARSALIDIFHPAPAIHSECFGSVYQYRKHFENNALLGPCDFIQKDFEETRCVVDLEQIITKVSLYVREEDRVQAHGGPSDGFYWVYCATSRSKSGNKPRKEA